MLVFIVYCWRSVVVRCLLFVCRLVVFNVLGVNWFRRLLLCECGMYCLCCLCVVEPRLLIVGYCVLLVGVRCVLIVVVVF